MLRDGSGGFAAATNFTAGTRPFSVALGDVNGDVNGDGRLDVAAANELSSNVSVLLGQP